MIEWRHYVMQVVSTKPTRSVFDSFAVPSSAGDLSSHFASERFCPSRRSAIARGIDAETALAPLAAEFRQMSTHQPPELFLGKYVLKNTQYFDHISLSVLVRVANSAVRHYMVRCV
jgi:hypothetical protein